MPNKWTPGEMTANYTRLSIGREEIAIMSQCRADPETELADAERVALCWNSHDALCAALEEALGVVQAAILNAEKRQEFSAVINNLRNIEERIRAALAKARG